MSRLINLDPALEVALVGGALALLAAIGVAWRGRRAGRRGWPAWQRVFTVATLFLTLDLVVFGAFTRLTDSGLGCPDWPGCYGETSPFAAHADIVRAHAAQPTGPVSPAKAWIEMTHRYLATGVGALITGLMLAGWRYRRVAGGLSPWWATLTFVWVCAQGAFGALTVTLKLQPIVVSAHLLGAMLGVALLTAQVRVLSPRDATVTPAWRTAPLRRWGMALLALIVIQIALGAWVSTNYAVLACQDLPTCQGQWWPAMDFETAFRLLRPLGQDGQGAFISLTALTAIHLTHRLMAVPVALAVLLYGRALQRWRGGGLRTAPWQREGRILWGLLAWQLLSGLSNVILGWPLLAALAHTLGATLLVGWLVRLLVLPQATDTQAMATQGVSSPRHQGLHATAPARAAP